MDDLALIRTNGNTDQPEATEDRPLVTFALFAYNQEKYIREAVEGAFSQTYSPLEIILSDDCSDDRTFEIMQEMANDYHGPHKVILRRNTFNLGTALHVQSAFAESSGKFFVVAAGDDISTPDRVATLSATWVATGCPEGVLHSGRETFRDGKTVARLPAKRYKFSDHALEGYAHGYWLPAAAPTCAYTRGVFECFGPLIGGSIIEDAQLQMRAALIGQIIPCDEVLVRQRVHDDNTGTGYSISSPPRWNRFMQSKLIAFRTMQRDLAAWDGLEESDLRSRIERRILAIMKSAPRLMLAETQSIGPLEKLRLGFLISTSPAVARTLRMRVDYALSFFGFEFHDRLKVRLRLMIGNFGKPY